MGRSDVLPFWFGEPDEPTPEFIRAAAKDGIDAGDVFLADDGMAPGLDRGACADDGRSRQAHRVQHSCAPGFVQCAGIVAIDRGEEVIAHTLQR